MTEESVKEVCSGLTSVRANERKKNAETLKEFLSRNAIPSLLTKNTLKKSGYTWNHVFDHINDYIMKETEKYEASKTFKSVTAPLCTNLLHLCVACANKGHAYIKCEKITDACLNILNDIRLTKAIGDAYLNLLYKYILPNENYLGYITPSTWDSFLDISMTACVTEYSLLDELVKIKLLWLIIKNACSYCQFAISLRDALPRIKKYFMKVHMDKKVQEFIIEITILLINSLHVESRLTICKFCESQLPIMFKFYEGSMGNKKKILLFKLFKMTIVIHHPIESNKNVDGTLAGSVETWNRHLHSILEIVCMEINAIQRQQKQKENLIECNEFNYVAASAFYRSFNMVTNENEEVGTSVKKLKISFSKHKCFSDLLDELHANCDPWIAIVFMYVKYYHSSISYEEYKLILSIIETIITVNDKNINWDCMKDLTCLVIEKITALPEYMDASHIFISFWNVCVRNATVANCAHSTIHTILQIILNVIPLKYHSVEPLLTSYIEKALPVNDHTLITLNLLYNKFYKKLCHMNMRLKFFAWLTQANANMFILDGEVVAEFLMRLSCNENFSSKIAIISTPEDNNVYNAIFLSMNTSILYSEFEYDIQDPAAPKEDMIELFEMNNEMKVAIFTYLEQNLSNSTVDLMKNDIKIIDYIKHIPVILALFDSLLGYHLKTSNEIKAMSLYTECFSTMRKVYKCVNDILKSNTQVRDKIAILKAVQNILLNEYHDFLNMAIRQDVDTELIHCIYEIIIQDITPEDDDYYEDDIEFQTIGLKQNCIFLLSAYCRKRSEYTDELVKRILDIALYNFTLKAEVECALKCISLLNYGMMEASTLESVFTLMQGMCRELFRNPTVTRGLLKILLKLLDTIWLQNDDVMRHNCLIMINSYLRRCSKMPPDVAALVYECLAKVIRLNVEKDDELLREYRFKEILMNAITDSNHCIRLYCCYLLTVMGDEIREEDITYLSDRLSNIFMVDIPNQTETVLRDESINRALTVLRCFYVLGITKTFYIHDIVFKVILFENEKLMDKCIVKKVLNVLTQAVTSSTINIYMNNNMLRILYYWFEKGKTFENIPFYLFGLKHLDDFVETHMKWLASTDIVWRSNGVVTDSAVLKYLKTQTKKSNEEILEICFCNLISLCLPYVAADKYKLESVYLTENAIKIFQSTRDILNHDKWSHLFVENLGEILYLTATQVEDIEEASALFSLCLQCKPISYTYSKRTFSAILRYFSELIDENIMPYLCKNQPILLLSILFKLWDRVLNEKIFDFKVSNLYAYLSFVENIPLGNLSDALFCNYLITSFTSAIRNSNIKKEIDIFVKSLQIIILKIMNDSPKCLENIEKSRIGKIVSVLNTKMEEGHGFECNTLLKYLTKDIKEYINIDDSVDVVDCINLMANHKTESKVTKSVFLNRLEMFSLNLTNASYNTVTSMCQLLKENKPLIKELYADINSKGFSEDCRKSLVHKIVFSLTNILKSNTDEKIIIEACNCLSEICTYDMKTLVTVPPADTMRIIDLNPKQYFANMVLESLLEYIFDEDPAVSKKVTKALNALLKYQDGQAALEMVEDDKPILKSLSSTDCNARTEYKIDNATFDKYNDVDFWVPVDNESHYEWITRITSSLLDILASSNNYVYCLRAVCNVKATFCRKIMPVLMGLVLSCSTDIHVNVFTEQIKQVFTYICEKTLNDDFKHSGVGNGSNKSQKLSTNDKIIVEYMLDVVNFVRIQAGHYITRSRKRSSPWLYLQLQYERVARAAAAADQHWPALYYGELHADQQGPERVRDVFRKSFVAIGEMDAIDGCGIAHLTSEEEKRKHLMSTGQYVDALLLHDIALSRSLVSCPSSGLQGVVPSPSRGGTPAAALCGAVACLHRSGMHHLALRYIQSYPENDELDDIKYDCLSYLGDWSEFVDSSELEARSKVGINQNSIIKAMRYVCLKDCINIKPSLEANVKFEKPLNSAKLTTARLCQKLNMENCQSVYKVLGYLHLFRDIEYYFSVRCNKKTVSNLIDEWNIGNLPTYNNFKHLEPLISQRSLILEQIVQTDSMYLSKINNLQLQYAELGLMNNRIQMAQRLVAAVKKEESSQKVVLLESQISWAKGHKDIALSLLSSVISQNCEDQKLTAISLRQYGLWMAESKRENSSEIHSYLKKSLEALNGHDDMDTRRKVYYDIAKFADEEYKQVVAYMESSIFENKVKCVESMKGTAESLKTSQQTVTRDEDKAILRVRYRVNTSFGQMDEAEIASTRAEKESYLKLAMRYYLLSLKENDENDLSVFRVISLWLDNIGFDFEDEEFDFGQLLDEIPSWKFIAVLPQLAPRLSNDSSVFSEHLRKIIMRCATEHPHHTLPILFSLKNSEKGEGRMSASPEPRVSAAAALLSRLKDLAPVLKQMELICDATISFAYCVPESKDLKPQAVPRNEAISKLRNLDSIPIPTDTVPLRKDCDYSNLNTLISFEKYFELVGGINYPKKISCLSSDGKKRILLIKGKDDMRQDAVMQQVFNIVNTLLEKNPVTNRNKLLIRTYKVVPMSRRSGVLQWCDGTTPLGAYLITAHTKYRPDDITPTAARNKLKICHDNRKSNKYKLEVFKEILKVFKPVFHYFFFEHYLDPVTWYERRLAYTRSVAASSMVGYILGIGDRHVQNILIDKTTAEVIHIDFGIAFDQGKTLPTPETIPFRLTQDIVAGFGSSGVEGSFRRCCEKTLQLLRDNQETLLTILEVLLCDPLYLWTVSTGNNANTSRAGGCAEEGGLAARALLAVRSKLCGAEGGAGGVSVAGHVARLLRAAAGPANLARLYPGWQPYM